MEVATFIGLGAAACTTISFLPQAIKSWKTKSMKDVSLPMYILLVTGSVLWLSYGIMLKDTPLILANGVGLSFISLTFFMKIRYG